MTPAGLEAWGGLVMCKKGDGACALAGGVTATRGGCAFLDASPEDSIPQEGYYCRCWDFLRGQGCETNDQPWRFAPLLWEICLTSVPCLLTFIFSVWKLKRYKRTRKEPTPIALHCLRLVAIGSFFLLAYTANLILWLGANIYELWQEKLLAISVPIWAFPLATAYVLQIFIFEKILADVPTKVKQPRRLGRKGSLELSSLASPACSDWCVSAVNT